MKNLAERFSLMRILGRRPLGRLRNSRHSIRSSPPDRINVTVDLSF